MKAIVTFAVLMLFCASATAQDHPREAKENVIKITVTDLPVKMLTKSTGVNKRETKPELAMLFKFRNSLIKESLAFTTDTRKSLWA